MSRGTYIGIDAGQKNGFAIWNSGARQFESIETLSFWDCIEKLTEIKSRCDRTRQELTVVIEDVTQNPVVFLVASTYQKTAGNHSQKLGAVAEQSRRVGTVWDKTVLIIEWCERYKVKIIRLRPSKKSMTKMKADTFNNMTKWKEKTNEHERDAALLVFGR